MKKSFRQCQYLCAWKSIPLLSIILFLSWDFHRLKKNNKKPNPNQKKPHKIQHIFHKLFVVHLDSAFYLNNGYFNFCPALPVLVAKAFIPSACLSFQVIFKVLSISHIFGHSLGRRVVLQRHYHFHPMAHLVAAVEQCYKPSDTSPD